MVRKDEPELQEMSKFPRLIQKATFKTIKKILKQPLIIEQK